MKLVKKLQNKSKKNTVLLKGHEFKNILLMKLNFVARNVK